MVHEKAPGQLAGKHGRTFGLAAIGVLEFRSVGDVFVFLMECMMDTYLKLATSVLEFGELRGDRTGTGTYSLFSPGELRYSLRNGFPIVTTKRIAWRFVVAELLWFLRGDTNVTWLQNQGVDIWDVWADDDGNLGPVYGKQWRSWDNYEGGTVDQISRVVRSIRENPESRRHIVSAWNVGQLHEMALPPCHLLFQFYVSEKSVLHVKVTQRSADVFLGLPFNISSYALLLSIVARLCDLMPGEVIMSLGDAHVYLNHVLQMREQIQRTSKPLPELVLPVFHSLDALVDIDPKEFQLKGYEPWPSLRAKIAV